MSRGNSGGRHSHHAATNSRGMRSSSKILRGVPNALDTRRLDELLNGSSEPTPTEENDMSAMDTVTDTARKLVGGARDAIGQLRAADVELRQAHAQAEAERSRLLSAKAPRPEVIAAMETAVDAIAAEARGNLGPRLVQALSGHVDVEPSGKVLGLRPGDLAHAFQPQPLVWQDLAALAPDILKASLRASIETATYQEGPPMAERLKLIAEVDKKIAGLEQQHAELVDEAAAAGIPLAHLERERIKRLQAEQRVDRARAFNEANASAITRGVVKPQ